MITCVMLSISREIYISFWIPRIYTLNKHLEIFESMDKKHLAILESISENEGEWFAFLLEETNKKISISQKPFGRRLKDLQVWGYVTKRGWSYYSDTPRIKKTDYSKLNKELTKLRKKVKRISEMEGSPAKKISLMKKIFYEWYVPISYEKMWQISILKPGEIFKINHVLEKCEKMIIKISTALEKWQPGVTTIMPYYRDLVFIEKVKK